MICWQVYGEYTAKADKVVRLFETYQTGLISTNILHIKAKCSNLFKEIEFFKLICMIYYFLLY